MHLLWALPPLLLLAGAVAVAAVLHRLAREARSLTVEARSLGPTSDALRRVAARAAAARATLDALDHR